MTTQEFNLRLIVIDGSIVLLLGTGNRPEILDEKRAKQALRFLGLTKEPVLVPSRSLELAKKPADGDDDKPVTGVALRLLSTLAAYDDPLTGRAVRQLLSGENPNTISSRLSVLKKRGYVSASGVPSQYMVTGEGHGAVKAAAERQGAVD